MRSWIEVWVGGLAMRWDWVVLVEVEDGWVVVLLDVAGLRRDARRRGPPRRRVLRFGIVGADIAIRGWICVLGRSWW